MGKKRRRRSSHPGHGRNNHSAHQQQKRRLSAPHSQPNSQQRPQNQQQQQPQQQPQSFHSPKKTQHSNHSEQPLRDHPAQSQQHSQLPAASNKNGRTLNDFRKNLPVFPFRQELVTAILGTGANNGSKNNANNNNKVVLITAETGSGKSTQIPAYLLEEQHQQEEQRDAVVSRIAVTQPRRVAAMTLAHRVALEHYHGNDEMTNHDNDISSGGDKKKNGSSHDNNSRTKSTTFPQHLVGRRIGYRVRFDDCTHPEQTQLIYMTDGMLLREAMVDPLLQRYNVIFLDECHERSLQTDILLGVVQRARKERNNQNNNKNQKLPPLRTVVMSATLQVQTFCDFFGQDQCQTISIPGRTFDVQHVYTNQPVDEYIDAACSTILQIHEHEENGDVLVFLPGQEEIEDLGALLRFHLEQQQKQQEQEQNAKQWTGDKVVVFNAREHLGVASQMVGNVLICLLYASLPPEAQLAAFQPKPEGCTRKIVLATNIAETSVTIPDIKFVVDTGKHKCRQISSTTGMESLKVQDVSQAQAAQRSGRAGRVAEGTCFRLFTEEAFDTLEKESVPEILRVNLAQVILQLKGMGVSDPSSFDFVSPPDRQSLKLATKVLYGIGALDRNTLDLNEHGKKLAKLPLDPMFGHLLLQSEQYTCVKEMLTAVSVLSAENLFYRPNSQSASGGGKAAAMHRRFISHEGDLPTGLNVYKAWQSEAVYVPPSSGGLKMQKRIIQQKKQQLQQNKQKQRHASIILSHGDWCHQNFISARAMVRAHSIREQLQEICQRQPSDDKKNSSVTGGGLGMDVTLSCGKDIELFYRAVAAGLYLQAASRNKHSAVDNDGGKGRSGNVLQHQRGAYKTKMEGELVSIHPSSALFGRNPAPSCVCYTELVTTSKTYIRGVTQIREEWLHEVAPDFYR